jgi:hypothetical protein
MRIWSFDLKSVVWFFFVVPDLRHAHFCEICFGSQCNADKKHDAVRRFCLDVFFCACAHKKCMAYFGLMFWPLKRISLPSTHMTIFDQLIKLHVFLVWHVFLIGDVFGLILVTQKLTIKLCFVLMFWQVKLIFLPSTQLTIFKQLFKLHVFWWDMIFWCQLFLD